MNIIKEAPLSASQQRFYQDFCRNPKANVGGLPRMYKMPKAIDAQRLADAITTAFKAHKAFSMRFSLNEEGEPYQQILSDCLFEQKVEQMTDEQLEALKETIVERFEFFGEPLVHSRVIETPTALYWFLDIHHTVRDANSILTLFEDVNRSYDGLAIEPEIWTPCDVALYEKDFLQSENGRSAVEMLKPSWQETVGCFPPGDLQENDTPAISMKFVDLDVDMPRMAEFTKSVGCPLSALSAAACCLLLSHETCNPNAAIVTAFNCRDRKEVERTVSMVTRYLLFTVKWSEEMTIEEFLSSANRNVMIGRNNAYANLLAMNELNKDFSDYMELVFQGNMMNKMRNPILCGEQASVVTISNKNTFQKPFNIHFVLFNGNARLMFLYDANRYSEHYITAFARKYENILNRIQTASTVGELLQ